MQCLFCSSNFSTKSNLKKHVTNKKCALSNTEMLWELHENHKSKVQTEDKSSLKFINNGTTIINNNIQIILNPANKLNVSYLKTSDTKELVETSSEDRSILLLSEYIKEIIANKEHPENHCIKYVTKRPPTFSSVIEENGENKVFIKNLKESCEILSTPIISSINQRLRECKKELKNDEDFQDEYKSNTNLRNKNHVKKAIKSVLNNDILHDSNFKT